MPDSKPVINPGIVSFGEPLLIDLSGRALIHVSGGDASRFLQNQLTNDISKVSETQGQLAAWCSAKGRVLAIFRIFRPSEGEYLLELPASLLQPILKRLQMFVLRSDVKLVSGNHATFAVTGDAGEKLDVTLPDGDYAQTVADDLVIMRIPGEPARYQIAGTADAISKARNILNHTATADSTLWRWLDIRAGQPSVWPETQERFTPHMLNLDLLGGVSFNKGCYPGQEIVARTKFLGKVKQRMVNAHTDAAAERGEAVFTKDAPRQAAGYVVDAIQTPEGCDLLVTVKNAEEESAVYLGSADGTEVRLQRGS